MLLTDSRFKLGANKLPKGSSPAREAKAKAKPTVEGRPQSAPPERLDISFTDPVKDPVKNPVMDPIKTVESATRALGIDPKMKSNPDAIVKVLDDMGLRDFKPSNPAHRAFLNRAKSEPLDLAPMISRVQEGLVEDHPAICEFLDESLKNDWLKPNKRVQEAIHYGYVLECLTAAMANDTGFSQEIRDHLFEKRRDYGIKPHNTLSTLYEVVTKVGLFEGAKTVSVDPAMQFITMTRANDGKPLTEEQIEERAQDGKLSWLASKVLKPTDESDRGAQLGMRVNVMEAALTDYRDGRVNNALTGYILAETAEVQTAPTVFDEGPVMPVPGEQEKPISPLHGLTGTGKNTFPHDGYDSDWTSLYGTWNSAFILGEMEDPHVLLPKLFIPSLLCAEPEHYVGVRTLSLWLTINTFLSRRLQDVEPVEGPENKEEMAQAWGRINQKYALELAENKLGDTPETTRSEFDKDFERPVWNFAKLAGKYL